MYHIKSKGAWAAVVVLVATLLFATPVLAIALPADGPLIQAADAYQSCLVSGDVLYIIEYYVLYNPPLPTETITESFIGRVLSSAGVDLGDAAPYAYYNKGYGYGLFAVYLPSGTWNAGQQIQIAGNPTLTWPGTPPVAPSNTSSSITWHTSTSASLTSVLVASKILSYATSLGNSWALSLSQVNSNGATTLTSYGQQYFSSAIPGLLKIAPAIFPAGEIVPIYVPPAPSSLSYMQVLLTRWTPYYTPWFQGWADWTGWSLGTIEAAAWCIPILIIGWIMSHRVGDPRPIPALLLFSVPFGALIGLLTPVVAIVLAFMSALVLGFVFAWGRSNQ